MSTGLNCVYLEHRPGEWYYVLEGGSSPKMAYAPKMAYDWRGYATAYGPFASHEAARENLHNNHANPGGSFTLRYDANTPSDATYDKLVATARRPTNGGGYESQDGRIFGHGPLRIYFNL